ncbi:MAG: efflux RND transporter periplasmic adaptor subunit, partial [Tepidimonas sp.]
MSVTPIRPAALAAAIAVSAALAGCQRPAQTPAAEVVPYVRTAAVQTAGAAVLGLSGTVRARVEAPLAFQVGGRVMARRADAGQSVAAGQVLFEIDPTDLDQAVQAALADAAAAETAWRTAQADLARVRELHSRAFVSAQALERAELTLREAQSRRDAAAARLAQARN